MELPFLENKPCQYCNHAMTDDLLKLNEAYHRIGQECTVEGCTCGHWLLVADTSEALPFGKLETIQEVA